MEPIHSWRLGDGLKLLDHALVTQQCLTWHVNSKFCRMRKISVLGVETLACGARVEKNKYPDILEIFVL